MPLTQLNNLMFYCKNWGQFEIARSLESIYLTMQYFVDLTNISAAMTTNIWSEINSTETTFFKLVTANAITNGLFRGKSGVGRSKYD